MTVLPPIQMDIKIHGLTRPIVEGGDCLRPRKQESISMNENGSCIAAPRAEVGQFAPKIISVRDRSRED